jgi:hypothetical protein
MVYDDPSADDPTMSTSDPAFGVAPALHLAPWSARRVFRVTGGETLMARRLTYLAMACVFVFALTGCSTSPSTSATSVAVTGPTLEVGATGQFKATATLSDGTKQDVTAASTWTSSNTAVATVTATGMVTAVTVGMTTITATYQGTAAKDTIQIIG